MGATVGVGRAIITPSKAGASAGWSIAGPKQVSEKPPHMPDLVATALAISDGAGPPVVLVFCDLHCGGKALWRALSQRTGVTPERLIVAGTHTHAGPGHHYGSALYNATTTPVPVPVPVYAHTLAKQMAPAVRQAITGAVPGTVRLVSTVAHDVASNRAAPAVMRIDEAERRAFRSAMNAEDGPTADMLRDPRVRTLVACQDGGKPFAALATAAVHGTALGPSYPHWGADWAGPARRRAESTGCVVGLAGGASGDVSPLALDERGERRQGQTEGRDGAQGEGLATAVGDRVGDAVLQSIDAVVAGEPRFGVQRVSVAHELWRPADDPRLGPPRAGLATAAGGIDGVTSAENWGRFSAGVDGPGYPAQHAWPAGHPHHPKVPIQRAWGLGALPISTVTGTWLGPRALPLHVVRLGDTTLVTVPGEPTTFVAWRIEQAVQEVLGGEVVVVGFSGDYAGYWVTPQAYDQQRYEGASTLFGRQASTVLQERLVGLAGRLTAPPTETPPSRRDPPR